MCLLICHSLVLKPKLANLPLVVLRLRPPNPPSHVTYTQSLYSSNLRSLSLANSLCSSFTAHGPFARLTFAIVLDHDDTLKTSTSEAKIYVASPLLYLRLDVSKNNSPQRLIVHDNYLSYTMNKGTSRAYHVTKCLIESFVATQ